VLVAFLLPRVSFGGNALLLGLVVSAGPMEFGGTGSGPRQRTAG
jgi:hypothetical protein